LGLCCRPRGGAAGAVLVEGGKLDECNHLESRKKAGESAEWRGKVAAAVADMLAVWACIVDTALAADGRKWEDVLAEAGRSVLKSGDSPLVGVKNSPRSRVHRSRKMTAAQHTAGRVQEYQPVHSRSSLAGWMRMPALGEEDEKAVAEGIEVVVVALEVVA